MKKTPAFTPATPVPLYPSGSRNYFRLNKPGGAGSFPCGGCWYGVAASLPGLHFFTYKATPYNEKHHQTPARAGNSSPRRKADHRRPQPGTGHANYGRHHPPTSPIHRPASALEGQSGQAPETDRAAGIIRANPSHNSLIFINLRCRVAA